MKTPFAIAATAAVGLSIAQPALGQSDDKSLARCISRHRAHRKRRSYSTAECSISIRSGIARRNGYSRMS